MAGSAPLLEKKGLGLGDPPPAPLQRGGRWRGAGPGSFRRRDLVRVGSLAGWGLTRLNAQINCQ